MPETEQVRSDAIVEPAFTRHRPDRLLDYWLCTFAGIGYVAYLVQAVIIQQPKMLGDTRTDLLDGPFIVTAIVGILSSAVLAHPYRARGLIAPGATGLFAATLGMVLFDKSNGWLAGVAGFGWGVGVLAILGACRTVRSESRSTFLHDFGPPALLTAVLGMYVALRVILPDILGRHTYTSLGWYQLLFISCSLAVFSWYQLTRPFVELALEIPCRIAYRYNKAGPGVSQVPTLGPCIIIANHAAYLDPLFLAGVAPRPITPMMTATFYDKPIIRQLMVYVFDTIRVPEVAMKRDTTEVAEAIAALDAGKCLVVFPEGWLRRKEDQPLRRFGRGIWQIVAARPDIPIFPCWIEGAWGSYFSFKNGPPAKNKGRDLRRPITVGVSAPVCVPNDVLTDHMRTRLYLMDAVANARTHLGLPKAELPHDPRPDDEPGDGGPR